MVRCAPESTAGRPVERWYACAPADTHAAHKAHKAHKGEEPIDTPQESQSTALCAKSVKSVKSPRRDIPSDLNALNAHNTHPDSDTMIEGSNPGDTPSSDPLNTLYTLFAQCAHTQTCQQDGQTVCLTCGEIIAEGQAANSASPAGDDEEMMEWTA